MTLLNELLEYNTQFVKEKKFLEYATTKTPNRKLLIVSCMDTRLTELSLKALGLKNGDIKQVKNAGAVISHPYGSTMRSILVGVYQLDVDEVIIMGHHDCGFGALKPEPIIEEMKNRGINNEIFKTLKHSGIEVYDWLKGFESVQESVQAGVKNVKNHPLMDDSVPIHGLVMDPETGKVDLIVNGYEY
ncbi:beta-class carbonic anhydrase [Phocicoccus pinnipedialis]|uniref:carbonic anhydrase n=1 Tax=Phocicoccus pinnipedialis TaxID=110845 RepID=A0A6V7RML8_9BACL|nr:carbonic anhydrase [Jeotgalicoccus pinnipedialis]MBP1940240.1 carbonic anhydrase [Jeotgalicoccus pinnipedialis]CAD2079542.1 Beta-carbonic anhydrase 1 [Jeotgalicoccus pinnipedialis]